MFKSKGMFVFTLIFSIILGYLANKFVLCCEQATASGMDIWGALIQGFDGFAASMLYHPLTLTSSALGLVATAASGFAAWLVALFNSVSDQSFAGKEYGTARWGTKNDIAGFVNSVPAMNILLTETESKSVTETMRRSGADDFNRNNNVCVVGGSGTGKSRFVIKPQLLQMYGSYVVTDPKGILFHECARMLQNHGYEVKVFDLVDRAHSSRYNPLEYIQTEDDILKLVTNLIRNTSSKESSTSNEGFWEKSETALLEALIAYIVFEDDTMNKNFNSVFEILQKANMPSRNPAYATSLDALFAELASRNPGSFALKQYSVFMMAEGETRSNILITLAVRLAMFNIESIKMLTKYDELELDTIGDKKTALFIILSDTDTSANFIAAILYQQLFDALVLKADRTHQGRLPVPVICLLDEFSNIGQIPNFHVLIATIRSRGIGAVICLQGLSQLKNLYSKSWETIVGNCDSFLYLGGMEETTMKYVSSICGKQTIDSQTVNVTKGPSGSVAYNHTRMGRELLTFEEVATLKGRQCVLKISRCVPFLSNKYPIERHPNYKHLADADKKNWFDHSDIHPR
jgi:type IV secretion system protein VirD4